MIMTAGMMMKREIISMQISPRMKLGLWKFLYCYHGSFRSISMQTFNSSLVRILTWDCGETLPERDIMDIIRRILLMTIMKWKVLKNFSEVGSPEEVPLVSG